MYPYLKFVRVITKKAPKVDSIWEPTRLDMRVWPGDIDVFMEVNNGRYLTLMDLGRFDLFKRTGLGQVRLDKSWGGAVAGASIRYRKRLHLFQRYSMFTQLVGLDERWWYFHQTIERNQQLHASALIRFAITDENGTVPVEDVTEALGITLEKRVPDWVQAWDKSDQMRPWQLMEDSTKA